jgi:hypothetical protein
MDAQIERQVARVNAQQLEPREVDAQNANIAVCEPNPSVPLPRLVLTSFGPIESQARKEELTLAQLTHTVPGNSNSCGTSIQGALTELVSARPT